MTQIGTVSLVGAGPGDPDLITVKGWRRLQTADVVVYDRLVNRQLLDLAPDWAEKIYVGKMPGFAPTTQADINHILISQAWQGKNVVRLKGGDPFVFGRGGEEAEALVEAGVPLIIVPGISSALGVPAYAGIPVTQRGVAQSFTVVTGHSAGNDDFAIAWDELPKSGTLVILMGVKNLPRIVTQLVHYGRTPDTAVAIIEQGTTPHQKTTLGTLETIVDKATGVRPPAIIVVGEVARYHQTLKWFSEESAALSR